MKATGYGFVRRERKRFLWIPRPRIFDSSVERAIPNRAAAAPAGPNTRQPLARSKFTGARAPDPDRREWCVPEWRIRSAEIDVPSHRHGDRVSCATEYVIRVRSLNPLDVKDRLQLNNDLATLAQFRESMYVNCWYLFDEEKAYTWETYGDDGVAVVSTYARLKAA